MWRGPHVLGAAALVTVLAGCGAPTSDEPDAAHLEPQEADAEAEDAATRDDPADGDDADVGAGGASGTEMERSNDGSGTTLQSGSNEPATSVELWVADTLTSLGAQDRGADTVVSLPDRVLFAFDEHAVAPEGQEALDEVAEVLLHLDAPARVEGHTDSRGDDDYNQQLSERRAEAVAEHLADAGVDPDRLSATGFGASRPVADNETPSGEDDPEGRAENRRVEIVIEGVVLAELGR